MEAILESTKLRLEKIEPIKVMLVSKSRHRQAKLLTILSCGSDNTARRLSTKQTPNSHPRWRTAFFHHTFTSPPINRRLFASEERKLRFFLRSWTAASWSIRKLVVRLR